MKFDFEKNLKEALAQGKSALEANLSSLQVAAEQAGAHAKKAFELNLSAANEAIQLVGGHVKTVLAAKDFEEVASLNAAFAKPVAQKVSAYAQQASVIALATKADVEKAAKAAAGALDAALKKMGDPIES